MVGECSILWRPLDGVLDDVVAGEIIRARPKVTFCQPGFGPGENSEGFGRKKKGNFQRPHVDNKREKMRVLGPVVYLGFKVYLFYYKV